MIIYLFSFRGRCGDDILNEHFKNSKKNATYRSKTIQNELIGILGFQIVSTIVNTVKSPGHFFSIIADEVQDCSNSEQLAIVIRYCVGEAGRLKGQVSIE